MTIPWTLLKKTWRDLKSHKYQVLALAVILGIGAGFFIGFEHMLHWRRISANDSYESLNMFDFQIDLLQDSYADISEIKPQLAGIEAIKAIEFRLVVPAGLNVSTPSKLQISQGKIIGINVSTNQMNTGTNRPTVNNYEIVEGDTLTDGNVCLAQIEFAKKYDLVPGQYIDVIASSGVHRLKIQGVAYLVEYLYLADHGSGNVFPGQFGALYVPLSTIQNMLSLPGQFNQIIVRATENNAEKVQNQISAILEGRNIDSTVVFREDYTPYRVIFRDIKNDTTMLRTISFLFMFIAGLGTYVMVSRMISAQRRLIGISRAVGYSSGSIIGQYVLFSAIIGIFAGILAEFLGTLIAVGMYNVVTEYFLWPGWQNPLQWHILVGGWLLCPLITSISGFFPAYRASRMKPLDAIRLDPHSNAASQARPGISHRIIQALPLSISVKLPLRNVFRNRRRAMSAIFGLGISVVLSISLLGLFDSIDKMIYDLKDDAGAWDLQARAAGFENATDWEITLTNASQYVDFEHWEVGLDLGGTLHHNSQTLDVLISGIQPNSKLRPVEFKKGSFEDGGLVISRRTASDLDLSVGDNITLEHLTLGGLTGFQLQDSSRKIIGIHDHIIAIECFMTLDTLRTLMGAGEIANVLYVSLGSYPEAPVRRLLYNHVSGIVGVESSGDSTQFMEETLAEIKDVFLSSQIFSLILAFAMIFNTVSVNVAERIRETSTMLTLGTPKRVVTRMILIENFLLGFFGLILGVILGQVIYDKVFINGLFKDTAPELIFPMAITLNTWLIVIGLFAATICLAQITGIRRAVGVNLAEATKTLE
ncbi:MAG: ABC transporter permease [Candidatus Hodarchaeota archaeon]